MKHLRFRLAAVVLPAIFAAGCGLIRPEVKTTATIDVTQAYETVQAQLTMVSVRNPEPATPTVTPTRVLASPTPTIKMETRIPGSATPTGPTLIVDSSCDKAAPGSPIDVTIEDDTEMLPEQRFTKIWRLLNSGTCTWTRQYKAVWFYGEKFGDTISVPFSSNIPPGNSVEIAVDMTAPIAPGSYRSNWMLENPSGELFGIGPNADAPFWVQIKVIQHNTPTATYTSVPSRTPTVSPTPTITPTPTETPVALTSGTALLSPGDLIDLDQNLVNTGIGEDLLYEKDGSGLHWLSPQETAKLGVYGASLPDLSACQTAGKSTASVPVESLSPGIYLCYQTGEGHFGWLKYISQDGSTENLGIQIFTWVTP